MCFTTDFMLQNLFGKYKSEYLYFSIIEIDINDNAYYENMDFIIMQYNVFGKIVIYLQLIIVFQQFEINFMVINLK